MSLTQLANQVVRLSEEGKRTPVLVTPSAFSLRVPFFVELSRELFRQTDGNITIEFFREGKTLATRLSAWASQRLVRRLLREIGRDATLSHGDPTFHATSTIMLSRLRDDESVILGCCDHQQSLPNYAVAIPLLGHLPASLSPKAA